MLIIDSPSNNAYFNIASEEYLLYKYPHEDLFLLYVNAPSIIVGKFQNTLAEINLQYVEANDIAVVRRLSGGGAVYHDLGNLNFSFHTMLGSNDFMDFAQFTEPVLTMLNNMNVPAQLEGRNDLLVDGKKFSGNAKLVKNGKMIQHGTILFDSHMEVLSEALKANPLKFIDKAVKSNRARVANLIDYLPEGTTLETLKQQLIEEMVKNNSGVEIYQLNDEDISEIQKMADSRYSTWEWNFGFSPNYNFKKAIKLTAGFIELHLDVDKGTIMDAKIFGDFFASRPIGEFEQQLLGKQHKVEEIMPLLMSVNLTAYFGKVTAQEIIELFQ